jgi:hypothetical protein
VGPGNQSGARRSARGGIRGHNKKLFFFFFDVQVWPYAAHQVETADWHTARSGSGGSTSVLLGVSEYDLDERAADPQIRNRRKVDLSLVHVGVACCHWTIVSFVAACD